VIYKQFDIVIVPFPFTDSNKAKRRPAIILSSEKKFGQKIDHSIMAMITSVRNKPWPLDSTITNLLLSGLPQPSVIRMKLFTLDHRLIVEKKGVLAIEDQRKLQVQFQHIFEKLL
jgi:mRNA interferase MazF